MSLEPYVDIFPAVIASQNGSTTVAFLSDNYTWVRLFGRPEGLAPAFNQTTLSEVGTPVWVKRFPKGPYNWQIVAVNKSYITETDSTLIGRYDLPVHGANHVTIIESSPAADPIKVYQPMNMILKTEGDGATLTVSTYPYQAYGFLGITTDLTASVPGAGLIRAVLFYFNVDTESLSTVEGTAVTDDGITPIPRPDIPDGVNGVKSAWVYLANGQTAVTTADDVVDARDFLAGQTGGAGTETGEIMLSAAGGWPSTTNGCATNAKNEYATNKQDVYTLDFDQASNEYAQWSVLMPDDWDGGVVAARFVWTADSGAGSVAWGLQGVAYNDSDVIDAAWGSPRTVLDGLIATGRSHFTDLTNAITIAGTPIGGSFVQFRVFRDTSIGDNLSADAKLKSVKLYYTRTGASPVVLSDLSTDNVVFGSVTADAFIQTPVSASATADAAIEASVSSSVTADAAVEVSESASVTADADIV